jgi:hypothetical protein
MSRYLFSVDQSSRPLSSSRHAGPLRQRRSRRQVKVERGESKGVGEPRTRSLSWTVPVAADATCPQLTKIDVVEAVQERLCVRADLDQQHELDAKVVVPPPRRITSTRPALQPTSTASAIQSANGTLGGKGARFRARASGPNVASASLAARSPRYAVMGSLFLISRALPDAQEELARRGLVERGGKSTSRSRPSA